LNNESCQFWMCASPAHTGFGLDSVLCEWYRKMV
jgi:hypothetical protein